VTAALAVAGISSFALLYAPQPILPLLAAEFQLDPGSASLAVGVATAALAITVVPIAALSEIVGRRAVIITSLAASVLLGIALPFAPSYEVFLVIRALQGIAIAGFPGVASAYLVEQLGARGVAAAVGAMIAGNTVGGMTGRLGAGFAADAVGWRGALSLVGGISLVCAAVAIRALPAGTPRAERGAAPGGRTVLNGLGLVLRSRVLLAQYAIALLAMGAFVGMYNVAGFRLTGEPLDLSPAIASMIFLSYAMGSVSSLTAGRLVARFGRARTSIGALCIAVAGALLTLPDSLPLVAAGFLVFTAGFFAVHAIANGWAAAAAPAHARGQASGVYTLAFYLGSSVGGTLGSVVYTHGGWGALVGATVVWLALASVAVLAARRQSGTPIAEMHAATSNPEPTGSSAGTSRSSSRTALVTSRSASVSGSRRAGSATRPPASTS